MKLRRETATHHHIPDLRPPNPFPRPGVRHLLFLLPALLLITTSCGRDPDGDGAARSEDTTMTDARKLAEIHTMEDEYHAEFPDVPEWTAEETLSRIDSATPPVLVDARKPAETEVSRIPGALTLKQFEKDADQYRDRPVVAYCTIGYRSSKLARKLRKRGFDAYNMRGSILAWLYAGGEVVDAGGNPVKRVHVYGDKWDLAPDGYETVK